MLTRSYDDPRDSRPRRTTRTQEEENCRTKTGRLWKSDNAQVWWRSTIIRRSQSAEPTMQAVHLAAQQHRKWREISTPRALMPQRHFQEKLLVNLRQSKINGDTVDRPTDQRKLSYYTVNTYRSLGGRCRCQSLDQYLANLFVI